MNTFYSSPAEMPGCLLLLADADDFYMSQAADHMARAREGNPDLPHHSLMFVADDTDNRFTGQVLWVPTESLKPVQQIQAKDDN